MTENWGQLPSDVLRQRADKFLADLRAVRDWMKADYHHSKRPDLSPVELAEFVDEVKRLESLKKQED